MAKLTILRGLPASGKSTLAHQICCDTGNTIRVNKDDLHAMLFNRKWSGKNRKFVKQAERDIAASAFVNGWNVVVDDTNLVNNGGWDNFTCLNLDKVEVVDVTTSIDECIRRDRLRDAHGTRVGRAIIEGMALRAGLVKWPNKRIIIVDIDGTIADLSQRLHCIETPGQKDYELFWACVPWDKPILTVIEWVRNLKREGDFHIVIVSGRADNCAKATEDWLLRHDVPCDRLFMRRGGDYRDDAIIKQEILDLLPKERIEFVIDDRPRVIRMWKANWLKVYPVNQGMWEGRD